MLRLRGSGERKLESYSCLVTLSPAGDKPPLFLTCWEGGRLGGYRDLVERLPDDLPVYGLRAPRFEGRMFTLQELASLFLAEVRRFRPEPPYLFGGYCFGGTLAHEMASQLEAEGATTAFLGLIESYPYGHFPPRVDPAGTVAGASGSPERPNRASLERAWLRTLAEGGLTEKVSLLRGRLFGQWGRPRRELRMAAFHTVCRTGWTWPGRLWNLNLITIRTALTQYVAPSSRAHITLFTPHDPADNVKQTLWTGLTEGGVAVRPITAPGIGHVSIMRAPYTGKLADELAQEMDAALRATRADGASATRATAASPAG